jgi:ribosomal protein S18 acetylase RimI-like enzyme
LDDGIGGDAMGGALIEEFSTDMTEAAAAMLARAFVTNPIHLAIFGPGQLAANETFFRMGLPLMVGRKLVALEEGGLVGLVHWIEWPRCQPSDADSRRLAPAALRAFGVRTGWRIGTWLNAWSKRDPASPHLHLGPIGVSPDAQGRGIGGRLMERYCEELDRANRAGYLETDRPEKVRFYERFGFQVQAEIEVLKVPNFLMARPQPGPGLVVPTNC